jgi:hypothetical protein
MHQWTPDQLIQAAQTAAESGRLQDAVTVLGYIVQSYPASPAADEARRLYRQLTGTDCPEAEFASKLDEGVTRASQAQAARAVEAAPSVLPDADAPRPAAPQRATTAVAAAPAAGAAAHEGAARRRDRGLLVQLDEELALELDARLGRLLAHAFFVLGFLLLPVGVLMLVFSLAFAFLLPWGLVALAAALPLIALAQLLRLAFDISRRLS